MAETNGASSTDQNTYILLDPRDSERFAAALQEAEGQEEYTYNPLGNGLQMLYDSRKPPREIIPPFQERLWPNGIYRERPSGLSSFTLDDPDWEKFVEVRTVRPSTSQPSWPNATPGARYYHELLENRLQATPAPRPPGFVQMPRAYWGELEDAAGLPRGTFQQNLDKFWDQEQSFRLLQQTPRLTQKIMKGLGLAGAVAGGAILLADVATAAPGEGGRTLAGGLGGMALGAIGGSAGLAAGAALSEAALLALGITIGAGPFGLVIMAGGLAGSIAVGGAFDHFGQQIGREIYDLFAGQPSQGNPSASTPSESSSEGALSGSGEQIPPFDQWYQENFGGPMPARPEPEAPAADAAPSMPPTPSNPAPVPNSAPTNGNDGGPAVAVEPEPQAPAPATPARPAAPRAQPLTPTDILDDDELFEDWLTQLEYEAAYGDDINSEAPREGEGQPNTDESDGEMPLPDGAAMPNGTFAPIYNSGGRVSPANTTPLPYDIDMPASTSFPVIYNSGSRVSPANTTPLPYDIDMPAGTSFPVMYNSGGGVSPANTTPLPDDIAPPVVEGGTLPTGPDPTTMMAGLGRFGLGEV